MRLGIIGASPGNGHPFSFSAIINGYDRVAFSNSGWDVIYNYLEEQTASSFGISSAKVTHAWTQDKIITETLCSACNIENAVVDYRDMIGQVDGVIIARDDYIYHYEMAHPFLVAGIPVFIDKPLTLDAKELEQLSPYLYSGSLMSTSGLRFAPELDGLADGLRDNVILINAVVLNDLNKYGIHMLDAVMGLGLGYPVSMKKASDRIDSYNVLLSSGVEMFLTCLGDVGKVFSLSIFGVNLQYNISFNNNFVAFKRTLTQFIKMIESGTPQINPKETISTMRALISVNNS